MMSKEQYVSEGNPHWHPHLMFYAATTAAESWGANLPESPLLASTDKIEGYTVFLLPVGKWSDGTPGPPIH
jgi:hypothetical protein